MGTTRKRSASATNAALPRETIVAWRTLFCLDHLEPLRGSLTLLCVKLGDSREEHSR